MTLTTTNPPNAPENAPHREQSLVCETCDHLLVRVVVCGTPERCTAAKDERHYHCLSNCGGECSSLGECKPKDGKK